MPIRPTRRSLLLGAGVALPGLLMPQPAGAARWNPFAKPTPWLPLALRVATLDGKPVVEQAWLDAQVKETQRLMDPFGIRLRTVPAAALPDEAARLETADDRDALSKHVLPHVINGFIVKSLRDVDDPKVMRMGVRWRLRRDLSKDYVIVAASALDTTLCHELGHYFGNGHSPVVNNVMSYRRDDPRKVAFNDHQGRKMRRVIHALLAKGRVRPVKPPTGDASE